MDNRRNYYRILHVQPDAPLQIIRSSYRTLMQKMRAHPDLGGNGETASLINEAYAVLKNPKARARYDKLLAVAGQTATRHSADSAGQSTRDSTGDNIRTMQDHGYQAWGSPSSGRCSFCHQPHGGAVAPEDECARCASPLYPANKSQLERNSQRAISRMDRRHPMTFATSGSPQQAFAGLTQDISLHGLQFLTNVAPPTAEVIRIETAMCRATARVVTCQPAAHGTGSRWQVGVEFLTLRFENNQGSFVAVQV